MNFVNLDERTRSFMTEELAADLNGNNVYMSPRLSDTGRTEYVSLLNEALETYDPGWLASRLREKECLNTHETRRTPKGNVTTAAVPFTAADTLAEGEFNRYYIRGLCRCAIEDGTSEVTVYRAKAVEKPRFESEMKIGKGVSAEALLRDLRTHVGVDTALGLPPGPNSGLSVRLS